MTKAGNTEDTEEHRGPQRNAASIVSCQARREFRTNDKKPSSVLSVDLCALCVSGFVESEA